MHKPQDSKGFEAVVFETLKLWDFETWSFVFETLNA